LRDVHDHLLASRNNDTPNRAGPATDGGADQKPSGGVSCLLVFEENERIVTSFLSHILCSCRAVWALLRESMLLIYYFFY
jgi:hypothetical protein